MLLQLAADPPAGRGGAGGRGGGGGGRGRGGVTPEVVDRARAEARAIIDGAWTGPAAASLVWAVGRTGAVRYRDRVDAVVSSTDAATREAAAYAARGWTRWRRSRPPRPRPQTARPSDRSRTRICSTVSLA